MKKAYKVTDNDNLNGIYFSNLTKAVAYLNKSVKRCSWENSQAETMNNDDPVIYNKVVYSIRVNKKYEYRLSQFENWLIELKEVN